MKLVYGVMIFLHTHMKKKGSKDVGVVVSDKKIRHTIVATLRGDGSALPPFWIQHRNANKRRKQKAIKGMNIMFMLKYIDEVLASNRGDAEVIRGEHRVTFSTLSCPVLSCRVHHIPCPIPPCSALSKLFMYSVLPC